MAEMTTINLHTLFAVLHVFLMAYSSSENFAKHQNL